MMAPSVDTICREMGEALRAVVGGVPGAETRAEPHGWLALSGIPIPDANYAVLDTQAGADTLRGFGAVITGRALPAIVFVASAANDALAPSAQALGFQHVGAGPLMVYEPQGRSKAAGDGRYRVERVTDDVGRRAAHPLIASAFSLPLDAVEALYGAALLSRPDVNLFVARRDGEPTCSVTTTGAGETIGIWSMATPPEQQRRGAGRATLEHAITYHRERGATTFYLGATEAGKRLYDQVGFRTLDDLAVWVAGQSTQFTSHA